jgi:hypothetical protein
MAKKKDQQDRLNVLVAAAAASRPRSIPVLLNIRQEDDDIIDTTAKEHDSKAASALHIHKHTVETHATSDTGQPCGLGDVTTSCIIEIDSELDSEPPIRVEDMMDIQSDSESSDTQGDTMSRLSSPENPKIEHARCNRDLSNPRSSWKASPIYLDESEMSSDGCESDSDKLDSDSGRCDLDDTQGAVARKLEELRRGYDPNDARLQFVRDGTMGCLRDRAALLAARDELTVMVVDKKMESGLRGRIKIMVQLLNLFLDEDLGYSWRKASLVVAKSESHSGARAQSMRQWVLRFVQTHDLPHLKYSWTRSTILEDEDVSQEIQFQLEEKVKNGSIKATDLVDVVTSPKIQEHFKLAGIDKASISERTAHRWMNRLGWRYGKQPNGMYIDGHEREDVVQYRTAFVQRFKQYERRFHLWDDNGEELPPPRGFPVPEAAGRFRLVLVTHDESTFFQNDQRKVYWDQKGSSKNPRPKGDGQSLMVSDFLTSDWGRLRDDNRCVLPHRLVRPPSDRVHTLTSPLFQ